MKKIRVNVSKTDAKKMHVVKNIAYYRNLLAVFIANLPKWVRRKGWRIGSIQIVNGEKYYVQNVNGTLVKWRGEVIRPRDRLRWIIRSTVFPVHIG